MAQFERLHRHRLLRRGDLRLQLQEHPGAQWSRASVNRLRYKYTKTRVCSLHTKIALDRLKPHRQQSRDYQEVSPYDGRGGRMEFS